MISIASRLAQTAFNTTHYAAERTIQASCSLLVAASRVSDYAQSLLPTYASEFWMIGQGALMTICGLLTLVKASRSHAPRKWRFPLVAGGICCTGVGICALVDSVGRLWAGVPTVSFASRQMVLLDLDASHASLAKEPLCLVLDAPHTFGQTCDARDHKNVFVMCHVANGNGDLVHCKKVFEFLEDAFPEHSVEIGYPAVVRNSLPRFFPEEFCKKVTYIPSYSDLSTRKLDLIVDCPVAADSTQLTEVIDTIRNGSTPHLGITEFDYPSVPETLDFAMKKHNHLHSTFLSAGLGTDCIGIPFDPVRYKASAATSFNDLKRLKNLASITSPQLQEAILGQPYSEKAIAAFHQRSALYPSYTHSSVGKDAFFSTILKLSNLLNDTREPCFVFVGRPLSP
ncbi:MAG: hypothetical protein ACHQT8_08290, partial [Chlamydiales bacterium]